MIMSAKRADMGSRDLISSLPDEVLGKILSSLPTNVAASTSVLSKRWRNLLDLVDNLDLNEASGGPLGFPEFMDKTLTLLRKSPTIKSLSLNFASLHDDSQMNTWIRTVMDCGGCLQLYLETASMQCIDTEFFTSNTLLDLTICDYFLPDGLLPPGGLFFPSLKKLSLVSVAFPDGDMYQHLISGCPVLEELFLHYNDNGLTIPAWNSVVSSPSIKRLTIFHHFPKFREPHEGCWIHTPGLLYLDYSSFVADQYEVDLGSLVEARLDIRSWERLKDDDGVLCEDFADDVLGNVTNLIAGISNVQILHLSPDSLEVFHFCCRSMPVFHNLITLSFESNKDRAWQVVPLLLRSSPNLETLAFKGLVHQVTSRCGDACACIPIRKKKKKKKKKKMEEGVCCLSTCQVKVLNISAYQGTCRELKQMRHFLGNLKCLETVNVCVNVNRQEDKDVNNMYLRITNALMELPRVSSNCRIHFF